MKECKVCGFKGEFDLQPFVTRVDIELRERYYTDGELELVDNSKHDYFESCPSCHIVYFEALEI